MGVQLIFLTL